MATKSVSQLTLDRVLSDARKAEDSKSLADAVPHLESAIHSFHHLLWDAKEAKGSDERKAAMDTCLRAEAAISDAARTLALMARKRP